MARGRRPEPGQELHQIFKQVLHNQFAVAHSQGGSRRCRCHHLAQEHFASGPHQPLSFKTLRHSFCLLSRVGKVDPNDCYGPPGGRCQATCAKSTIPFQSRRVPSKHNHNQPIRIRIISDMWISFVDFRRMACMCDANGLGYCCASGRRRVIDLQWLIFSTSASPLCLWGPVGRNLSHKLFDYYSRQNPSASRRRRFVPLGVRSGAVCQLKMRIVSSVVVESC